MNNKNNCAKKTRYNTKSEAKKAAKKAAKNLAYKLYYYKCDVCIGYHLSKMSPEENSRLTRYYIALRSGPTWWSK